MSYRGEIERIAREIGSGSRRVDSGLNEAYLLGIKAHGDLIQSQAPTIFRLATEDGNTIPARRWSTVKRFYETVTGARRALQHAPDGTKVQAGRVVWEDA